MEIWTPKLVSLVRQYLADGLSAGQISQALWEKHGLSVSRNSVIGKVRRDKSLEEVGFVRPSTQSAAKAAPKKNPGKLASGMQTLSFARVPTAKPRLPALPGPRTVDEIIGGRNAPIAPGGDPAGLSLADLPARGCRFAVRSEGVSHFFCAEDVTGFAPGHVNGSYCAFHRAYLSRQPSVFDDERSAA